MEAVDGGLDLFSIGPAKDSGLNDAGPGRKQEESQKEKKHKIIEAVPLAVLIL